MLLLLLLHFTTHASVCDKAAEDLAKGYTVVEKLNDGSFVVTAVDKDEGHVYETVIKYSPLEGKPGYETREVSYKDQQEVSRKKGFSEKPPISAGEMAEQRRQVRERKVFRDKIVSNTLKALNVSGDVFSTAKTTVHQRNPKMDDETIDVVAVGYSAVFSPNALQYLNEGTKLLKHSRSEVISLLRGDIQSYDTIGSGVHERFAHVIDGFKLLRQHGFKAEADARMNQLIAGLE